MKIRTETMVFDDARLRSTIEQTAEHILLEVSNGYYTKTQIDQTATSITALISDETENRTTLIRAKSGGVITAYQGQTYGVYTNASGSVDIVTLSWSGATPNITSTLASYGTSITLGLTSGKHLVIDSSNVSIKNGSYLYSTFGADGLHVYGGTNGVSLAQIGYKQGYDGIESQTAYAPYFSQGTDNINSGQYSLVSGRNNKLYSGYAYAIGESNTNYGQSSGCSGYGNLITEHETEYIPESERDIAIAGGYASHALGAFLVANKAFQTVIGIANEIDTYIQNYDSDAITSIHHVCRGKYAFIVGNGSYSDPIHSGLPQTVTRSNAFTVAWNGETTVNATGYNADQARLNVAIAGVNKVWIGLGSGGTNHGIFSAVRSDWIIAATASSLKMPLVNGLPSSGSSNLTINSNGTLGTSGSSKRFKHDIKPIDESKSINSDCLYKLPVVKFKYNKDRLAPNDGWIGKDIPGLIAEDVAELCPIAAHYDKDGKPMDWNERHIIPLMIKLIQDQKVEIDNLTNRIDRLEKQIA